MTLGLRLIEKIALGSRSEVWKAEAPGGLDVAVKIVFWHERARELQALELVKTLRHPHLVPVHAFFKRQDQLIIVMELAEASLRDHWRRRQSEGGDVPLWELVNWMADAAEAIDYLHDHGVIHSDVNADHILLLKGVAKIGGYSLARALPPLQRSVRINASRTPDYMSPEVWRGDLTVQSDQYSLACTYAELRLRRLPLAGRDQHLWGTPDLNALPESEQQVLLRALAKQADQRYEDCKAFVEGLRAAIQD